MAIIRNLVVKISADISSLQKGLKTAQSKMLSVSNSISRVGGALSMSITAPLALLGQQSTKTAAQFEQSMANAASVSSATAEEFDQMTALAREMGKTTVFSASEAADALYYMASGGYKVGQMQNAIQPILNLAAATQSELAFTTDTVIATLNQFGLESSEASRVSNTFAAAIGASQATMDKLAYSMRYVGPVANSLGYSLEETTAALGILYNAGFKGEQAGTILRGAMSRLLKPTSAIEKALAEVGLTYDDVNPSTNKFVDIIGSLEKAGITTAQAVAIFGQEAGPGMMAMIGQGSKALEEMTNKISNTDSATTMAERQLDTLIGSQKLMKSMMEEVAITIGNILLPIMNEFMVGGMMPLIEKFDSLSLANKELVVKLGFLAASIGPIILVVGKLVKVLAVVPKIMAAITGPVGLVVLAVTALIAILTHLWNTNEQFKTSVIAIWERIKTAVLTAIASIRTWWDTNGEFIRTGVVSVFTAIWQFIETAVVIIITIFDKLSQALVDLWNNNESFKNLLITAWTFIRDTVKACITAITEWWQANGEQLLESVTTIFTAVWGVIAKAGEIIVGVFVSMGQGLKDFWAKQEDFRNMVVSLWENIRDSIKSCVSSITEWWTNNGDEIVAKLKLFAEKYIAIMKAVFGNLWENFKVFFSYIEPIWEKLKVLIKTLWDTLKELYELLEPVFIAIGALFGALYATAQGVFNGIIQALGPLIEAITDLAQFVAEVVGIIVALLSGDLDGAFEHLKNAGSSLSSFFKNIWEGMKNFAKGFVDSIVNLFNSLDIDIVGIVKGMSEKVGGWFKNMWQGAKDWTGKLFETVKDIFGKVGDTIKGVVDSAFNWGKNLLSMFVDGLKAGIEWLGDGIKSIGQSIKDFLGFSSPTKKGPASDSDTWMPNMMSMFASGIEHNIPDIQSAVNEVGYVISGVGTVEDVYSSNSKQPTATSGYETQDTTGEIVNALLQVLGVMNQKQTTDNQTAELSIDGNVFARLILPSLTRELKRNGINLK